MSTSSPTPPSDAPATAEAGLPEASTSPATPTAGDQGSAPARRQPDALRGSRTSGTWVALGVLVVLLVAIATFVLQNTETVDVQFLGFSGRAPLAATLLIALAAGMLLTLAAGSLRILQLRRRVRRERKQNRK